MAALNKIILIGRLTANPELRYTPSGAPVANFTLAVDRKFSKNDETDFIPIVAWRRLAEICNEFLHKGKLVAIEGRLQTRTYEDREGNRRKAFEVVADEMQMLDRGGSPGGGSSGGMSTGHSERPPAGVGAPSGQSQGDYGGGGTSSGGGSYGGGGSTSSSGYGGGDTGGGGYDSGGGFPPSDDNVGLDDIPF